jgi:hypothetical protein
LKNVAEIQIVSFLGILITINDRWMMAGIEGMAISNAKSRYNQ